MSAILKKINPYFRIVFIFPAEEDEDFFLHREMPLQFQCDVRF